MNSIPESPRASSRKAFTSASRSTFFRKASAGPGSAPRPRPRAGNFASITCSIRNMAPMLAGPRFRTEAASWQSGFTPAR